MKQIVVSLGLAALLVLAMLDNSAMMFVSALGVSIAVWITREATIRTQVIAPIVCGLAGSIVAETVHTIYHLLGGETASGDSGFFFVGATVIGLSNGVILAVVVLLANAASLRRQKGR